MTDVDAKKVTIKLSEPCFLVSGPVSQMVACVCGDVFSAHGPADEVDHLYRAWSADHAQCREKPREGQKVFWLSFCDNEKPKGSQFLGACIVEVTAAEADAAMIVIRLRFPFAQPDAEWIAAASRKAHATGCNPGGEMASIDVTDAPPEELARYPRHVLLSKADLEAIGPVMLMDDDDEGEGR